MNRNKRKISRILLIILTMIVSSITVLASVQDQTQNIIDKVQEDAIEKIQQGYFDGETKPTKRVDGVLSKNELIGRIVGDGLINEDTEMTEVLEDYYDALVSTDTKGRIEIGKTLSTLTLQNNASFIVKEYMSDEDNGVGIMFDEETGEILEMVLEGEQLPRYVFDIASTEDIINEYRTTLQGQNVKEKADAISPAEEKTENGMTSNMKIYSTIIIIITVIFSVIGISNIFLYSKEEVKSQNNKDNKDKSDKLKRKYFRNIIVIVILLTVIVTIYMMTIKNKEIDITPEQIKEDRKVTDVIEIVDIPNEVRLITTVLIPEGTTGLTEDMVDYNSNYRKEMDKYILYKAHKAKTLTLTEIEAVEIETYMEELLKGEFNGVGMKEVIEDIKYLKEIDNI